MREGIIIDWRRVAVLSAVAVLFGVFAVLWTACAWPLDLIWYAAAPALTACGWIGWAAMS